MANGHKHINEAWICYLCCRHDKVKLPCTDQSCVCAYDPKKGPHKFHLSCARQAGLEVADTENTKDLNFVVKCFHHKECVLAFRALLEDFIEVERQRVGPLLQGDQPMSVADASRLYHWGVTIMQILGWAWRWAEWWVEKGDTWEPLIEPGQNEENMTEEQLKIVKSTMESRAVDARRCRLATFGAALRNRYYDREEGDDRVPLHRALVAVLKTPSLVGPIKDFEVEFFALWLARAYRSKNPLLGFGDDKIPVEEAVGSRCRHHDGSPKYLLGRRSLPGKTPLPPGVVFETVQEVDDFLQPENVPVPVATKKRKKGKAPDVPSQDEDAHDAEAALGDASWDGHGGTRGPVSFKRKKKPPKKLRDANSDDEVGPPELFTEIFPSTRRKGRRSFV